jgi:hypothetical protein
MTKEERQLLLVDLSARFPYNVAVDCKDEVSRYTCYLTSDMLREIQNNNCYWEYKPFLFPLSSMTKEQSKIYHELIGGMFGTSALINFEILEEFFNKNHFDYRGLIGKGLANDATNLNVY